MAISAQYYICNKCRFTTTLFSRINDHLLEHCSAKQPSPFSYFDCFNWLKPLKCPSCDFSSEYLILLRYHLVQNHDQQQFNLKTKLKTCKKCRFVTLSNFLWIRHGMFGTCKGKKGSREKKKVIVLKKRGGKWHLCKKCDYRTVNSGDLKDHVISKHTPAEEIDWQHCNKCPLKFKLISALKKHKKFVHSSTVHHFHCPECDYSTPFRHNLGTHFKAKHTPPEEIKWVECYHCGAKFKDKYRLKTHLVIHTSNRLQYKCDQCSFETQRKSSFNRHIINSHIKDEDIKWYNCQHCDYKSKRKHTLTNHIRHMHSQSVELVQCPHCSFKTKRNSGLNKHITRFHDDSVFKCDLCSYRAKCEKTVEIHKKNKHEVGDVKLFKCEHCDFSSKIKTNLKNHVLSRHNISGEDHVQHEVGNVKLFECEHCHYKFKYKENLENHVLLKHTTDGEVFQCKQCPYNTRSKRYLTNHMTKVHKPPRFCCENCSFATKTKSNLKRHIFNTHTVHTEEEKLNCSHCSYSSFSKDCLNLHLKARHKTGNKIQTQVEDSQ